MNNNKVSSKESTHQKLRHGIILFNQQKYWECHEVLEDIWYEEMGENSRFIYWAIIQVACSLIHYRDGNLAGANGMLAKAKEKFKECDKLGVITELIDYDLSWSELKNLVEEIGEDGKLEDFKKLYKFRFRR